MDQRIKLFEEEKVKKQEDKPIEPKLEKIIPENRVAWLTQLICKELEPFKQQIKLLNDKVSLLEGSLDELKKEVSDFKENQKADVAEQEQSILFEESKLNNGHSSVIYQDIKIERFIWISMNKTITLNSLASKSWGYSLT